MTIIHSTYEKHQFCTVHKWHEDGALLIEEGRDEKGNLSWRNLPTETGSLYASYSDESEYYPHWLSVHNHDGQMHCETGPSYIFFNKKTGATNRETWHIKGVQHHDGAPAEIHYNDAGEITWSEWTHHGKNYRVDNPELPSLEVFHYYDVSLPTLTKWTNEKGQNHRDGDLPACISHDRDKDGKLYHMTERWQQNGEYSRADGKPAYATTSPDGMIKERRWSINGLIDRADGLPAVEKYNHDGTIWTEEWWEKGLHHCDSAPALIQYKNNEVSYQSYYLNNCPVPFEFVMAPETVTFEMVLASDKSRWLKWEMIKIIGLAQFINDAPKQKLDQSEQGILYKIPTGYSWHSEGGGPFSMSKSAPSDYALIPEVPLVVLVNGDEIKMVHEDITTVSEALLFKQSYFKWSDDMRITYSGHVIHGSGSI